MLVHIKQRNPALVRALVGMVCNDEPDSHGAFKMAWYLTDSMGCEWVLKRAVTEEDMLKDTRGRWEMGEYDRSADDVLSEVVAQETGAIEPCYIAAYVAWACIDGTFWAVQPALEVLNDGDPLTQAECDAIDEWNQEYFRDANASYWNPDEDEEDGQPCVSNAHNVGWDKNGTLRVFDWGYGSHKATLRRVQGLFLKAEVD